MFSVGGVALAVLLFAVGLVMTSNANFANNYVTTQLSQQNITFKAADALTAEERALPCLVEFAGQRLTSGKQAECYANYIGVHLASTADGATYAELGAPQSRLRAQVAEAKKVNDPNLVVLEEQLAEVSAQRETLFKGETLRGLLLTSYGFSEFGVKAGQAALVAYLAAGLLVLLAVAGLIHAFAIPKTATFAAPEPSGSGELATA
jgi:hypothetical protein